MNASKALATLLQQVCVNKSGVDAWKSVRHKVMHGSLVSIYSDKEEDDRILALVE